ncbi:MAG: hypothetical protein ACQZ3N_09140 [cyanobacterium endosymbiont of Rhopalodia yunnanensis]
MWTFFQNYRSCLPHHHKPPFDDIKLAKQLSVVTIMDVSFWVKVPFSLMIFSIVTLFIFSS